MCVSRFAKWTICCFFFNFSFSFEMRLCIHVFFYVHVCACACVHMFVCVCVAIRVFCDICTWNKYSKAASLSDQTSKVTKP